MTQETDDVEKHDLFVDIIEPALKVGAASGGAGFLVGGTAGILKATTPFIFGVASAIQCASLGTTFWATRSAILQYKSTPIASTSELTGVSALAGGISGGAAGLLFRGPRNVLPGLLCMGGFGAGGQMIANAWHRSQALNVDRPGLWTRMTSSVWSPVQPLSNDDYATVLRERLLKVEVEIAILDDKIAALKQQASTETERKT